MKVLDIESNMNAQYLLYFVRLYQKALRENKVGSAIPHLNKKMFRELVIPVPPREEQERIVRTVQQYYNILDNISANLQFGADVIKNFEQFVYLIKYMFLFFKRRQRELNILNDPR